MYRIKKHDPRIIINLAKFFKFKFCNFTILINHFSIYVLFLYKKKWWSVLIACLHELLSHFVNQAFAISRKIENFLKIFVLLIGKSFRIMKFRISYETFYRCFIHSNSIFNILKLSKPNNIKKAYIDWKIKIFWSIFRLW